MKNIFHWLLECNAYGTERQYLMQYLMQSLGCVVGSNENRSDEERSDKERSDEDSVALILDRACQHFSIMKGIMKMWANRFQ